MSTDLLVLGAGPAGAAISLLMSRKGFSVEIVDAAHFPRPKICGEFLNPQACTWLQQQGLLSSVLQLEPYQVNGMKITDSSGNQFQGTYSEGCGYAVQRKDFDALLVSVMKEKGILLHEGFRASELLMENRRVVGVRGMNSEGDIVEKRARVTVGADGRNNLIGRTFGWMEGIPNLRKYAYITYFDGIRGLDHYGEIHLIPHGYVGVAPLRDDLANIALVIDEKFLPPKETDLKEFLWEHVQQTQLADRIQNHEPLAPLLSVGPLAYTLKQTSGNGTVLIGDTCGFIDPFTGEGINYAFLTASIAADVLQFCLKHGSFDPSLLMIYDEKRLQLLGRKFQMSRLLQNAVHSPKLARFLIKRFAAHPHLADEMVSAVGGATPVESVWNIRFLLRMIL